jgi:hypothetical protein
MKWSACSVAAARHVHADLLEALRAEREPVIGWQPRAGEDQLLLAEVQQRQQRDVRDDDNGEPGGGERQHPRSHPEPVRSLRHRHQLGDIAHAGQAIERIG